MKLLVITSRVPWPLEKGDKLRIYHQLSELSKRHEIVLCCLSDKKIHPEAVEKLGPLCHELHLFRLPKIKIWFRLLYALFSSKPFQVHYFLDRSVRRKIDGIIERTRPDHIFCQLIRTTEYVKQRFDIPKSLDYMDAFSKGTQRRINKNKGLKKVLLREESRRLARYENLIFDYFDGHSIISEQDRQFIRHPKKANIQIVSNGIDSEFFSPRPTDKDYEVLFTGNMNYPPNTEGAVYIVREVMPLVWKQMPEARVILAGVNDSAVVKSLASDRVWVTGWMDDIREAYSRSKLFLAPMQIGTGLQNKLLEAMSMGLPCITSELANNALKAQVDEEVYIGHSAQDYAEKVLEILQNPEKSKQLAESGKNMVLKNFSWSSSTKQLEQMLSGKHPSKAEHL